MENIHIEAIANAMVEERKLHQIMHYLRLRRIFEIIFILFLSPLILVICFIIALFLLIDRNGSLFFIQKRIGYQVRQFNFYKFRTLKFKKANEALSNMYNCNGIGAVSKFLRIHRLDELPQLLNVLKGDMSLIGPRPDPIEYFNDITKQFPDFRFRFILPPGLTGLAQVNYHHTETVEDAIGKYKYDMEYLEKISLRTDINIVWKTFSTMIFGNGAK
ncbi:MAG: sugar transferase [Ignavibacteria bacterium]|nr:sugar transferase [Ignavibacteria bacterium]